MIRTVLLTLGAICVFIIALAWACVVVGGRD